MFLYSDILGKHVVDVEKWCYNVIVHRDHCGCDRQNKSHVSEPESRPEVYMHRALKTVSNLISIKDTDKYILKIFQLLHFKTFSILKQGGA